MTELEIMERARLYMEKLANGINPLTDEPVGEDDVINNVRLYRCFFYVTDVLRQVIENGGVESAGPVAKKKKLPVLKPSPRPLPVPARNGRPLSPSSPI